MLELISTENLVTIRLGTLSVDLLDDFGTTLFNGLRNILDTCNVAYKIDATQYNVGKIQTLHFIYFAELLVVSDQPIDLDGDQYEIDAIGCDVLGEILLVVGGQ